MIAIRGANSLIAQQLIAMLPDGERAEAIPRGASMPVSVERYFFSVGLLRSKPLADQSEDEIAESMVANYSQVVFECDRIFSANACARVCVMGSESGYSGSFDGAYALGKARLHKYVETKRLHYPAQQLVCVAPSIVADAGMTLRRSDTDGLERRRWAHPKRRYLAAMEVAQMVKHLLYVDRGYTTGTIVRMHGGIAAWA
jgi:NAD(P)-dependent dehydrogenase (short-subunit alcohol dehydrogenase family)